MLSYVIMIWVAVNAAFVCWFFGYDDFGPIDLPFWVRWIAVGLLLAGAEAMMWRGRDALDD
jgi:ABC-type multidrug transport system permease subunit